MSRFAKPSTPSHRTPAKTVVTRSIDAERSDTVAPSTPSRPSTASTSDSSRKSTTLPRVATLSVTPRVDGIFKQTPTRTPRTTSSTTTTTPRTSANPGTSSKLPRLATYTPKREVTQPVTKQFVLGELQTNARGEVMYTDADGTLPIDKVIKQLEDLCAHLKVIRQRDKDLDGTTSEASNTAAADDHTTHASSEMTDADTTSAEEKLDLPTPDTNAMDKASSGAETLKEDDLPPPRLAVLVLPGVFAPVHNGHLELIATAKEALEQEQGYTVLGAYLSVAPDSVMRTKVMNTSQYMEMEERQKMCKMACKDSDFIDVCTYGWASAERLVEKLKFIFKSLIASTAAALEQLGPNATLDIITVVSAVQATKVKLSPKTPYVFVGRPPHTTKALQLMTDKRRSADSKVWLVCVKGDEQVVEPHKLYSGEEEALTVGLVSHHDYNPPSSASSTKIRELLFAHDRPLLEDLEGLGWVHPVVLKYMHTSTQRFGWLCRK